MNAGKWFDVLVLMGASICLSYGVDLATSTGLCLLAIYLKGPQ